MTINRRQQKQPGSLLMKACSIAREWGHTLTASQLQTVDGIISGRDVFAVSPTGSGKSEPAFLAAAMRDDLCWGGRPVCGLFPLISLTEDQNRKASNRGLRTAAWNGNVPNDVKSEILDALSASDFDMVLTTPESLQHRLGEKAAGHFQLAWIDEVHISMSCRYFRTAWARVGDIIKAVDIPQIYACTATCRRTHQPEMIARGGLRNPLIIRLPPTRPNIKYCHMRRSIEAVTYILEQHKNQRIIIYAATRLTARQINKGLKNRGYNVDVYHGGLSPADRQDVHERWNKAEIKVLVATEAFGLGVDLPDVRAVVLFDPSGDITDFIQEAGRAGRDGDEAFVYLCSQNASRGWQSRRFLLERSVPKTELAMALYESIHAPVEEWPPHSSHRRGMLLYLLQEFGLIRPAGDNVFERTAPGQIAREVYESERSDLLNGLDELKRIWQLDPSVIDSAVVDLFEDPSPKRR